MRSRVRCTVLLTITAAVLLALTPRVARAQSDTGVIDGRVLDESKAALPGAIVTARNVDTGFSRSATSSGLGTYRLEFLPPGKYEVTAALASFATAVAKDVVVQVGTSSNVDFAMKLGGVTETLTVSAESPLVQTTKSDVGQVINSTLIENMPLSGRQASRICRSSCPARVRRTTTIRPRPRSAASVTAG